MSERSVTIWNLVIGLAIFSLIASSFKLFPMNTKYGKLKARSQNVQFGTDKELENIITYLEKRLEERSQYYFSIENTPMMLTNVLTLADGTGRHTRRNRNALRVALVYQREDYFQAQLDYRGKAFTVSVGDTVQNIGVIEMIDKTQVLINTGKEVKSYSTPQNGIIGIEGGTSMIKVSNRKKYKIDKGEMNLLVNSSNKIKPNK
ncbi:MAG: hypothetical protein HOB40_00970 [Candidatus Marinimicrobia bacterium]|jgi:hypothetical protein|nr:hypothetical protein [Candidatus Neomarinimicrobiota bacterium]MBT3502375.1 hypothetical protein [Candidatus Neomarinimicrobiota bacterium]MBT3839339.1 hypothetical protein [Candidatus Neomarinimicrobiota bacterium]MBT4000421.1 hypothetical protein [Candidatus Neomarinimicrobiota bacterium]MBT4283553.1 hypothetical protein [Candidatus Neomarinimicrobiota bacterium]